MRYPYTISSCHVRLPSMSTTRVLQLHKVRTCRRLTSPLPILTAHCSSPSSPSYPRLPQTRPHHLRREYSPRSTPDAFTLDCPAPLQNPTTSHSRPACSLSSCSNPLAAPNTVSILLLVPRALARTDASDRRPHEQRDNRWRHGERDEEQPCEGFGRVEHGGRWSGQVSGGGDSTGGSGEPSPG